MKPYTAEQVQRACGDSVVNIRHRMQNADEHDVVITINGRYFTRREFIIEVARSRKIIGAPPPECPHKPTSPIDGLCLNCGEYHRDS